MLLMLSQISRTGSLHNCHEHSNNRGRVDRDTSFESLYNFNPYYPGVPSRGSFIDDLAFVVLATRFFTLYTETWF